MLDRANQIVLAVLVVAVALFARTEFTRRNTVVPPPAPPAKVDPEKKEPVKVVRKVIKIKTEKDFVKYNRKNTVFVWSAEWCAACIEKKEKGWWDRLQKENQDVQVVICDFDSLRSLASQKGIRLLPSVMLNNKKRAVDIGYKELSAWVRRYRK